MVQQLEIDDNASCLGNLVDNVRRRRKKKRTLSTLTNSIKKTHQCKVLLCIDLSR
jgi:hypothetical protein